MERIAECRDAGRKKCLRSQSVLRAVRPGLEVCGHSDDLEVGIVRSIYKGSIKDFEFNLLPNRIFGAEVFTSKRFVYYRHIPPRIHITLREQPPTPQLKP